MGRRTKSKMQHLKSLRVDGEPLPRAEVERLRRLPRRRRDAIAVPIRIAEKKRPQRSRP